MARVVSSLRCATVAVGVAAGPATPPLPLTTATPPLPPPPLLLLPLLGGAGTLVVVRVIVVVVAVSTIFTNNKFTKLFLNFYRFSLLDNASRTCVSQTISNKTKPTRAAYGCVSSRALSAARAWRSLALPLSLSLPTCELSWWVAIVVIVVVIVAAARAPLPMAVAKVLELWVEFEDSSWLDLFWLVLSRFGRVCGQFHLMSCLGWANEHSMYSNVCLCGYTNIGPRISTCRPSN